MSSLVIGMVRQFKQGGNTGVLVDQGGTTADVYAGAERKANDFTEKLAAIKADTRLSESGKSEAIAKLAREHHTSLEKWRDTVQGIYDNLTGFHSAKIREAIAPRSGDDVNQSNLRREVRDAAREMNDRQREQLYREGSALVRHALEELPAISVTKDGAVLQRAYVTDELRKSTLLEAGRRAVPETARALEEARGGEQQFHTLAAVLGREITAAAPDAVKPEITIAQPRKVG